MNISANKKIIYLLECSNPHCKKQVKRYSGDFKKKKFYCMDCLIHKKDKNNEKHDRKRTIIV
jgi:hypothetical protein